MSIFLTKALSSTESRQQIHWGNAQHDAAPLALLTKTALTAGQSFTTDGVTIGVGEAVLGGGFAIQVSMGVGIPIIVWYNSDTGETQIWFMDSNTLAGRATVVDQNGPALVGPPFS